MKEKIFTGILALSVFIPIYYVEYKVITENERGVEYLFRCGIESFPIDNGFWARGTDCFGVKTKYYKSPNKENGYSSIPSNVKGD